MRGIFIAIGAAMLWAVCACSTKSERREAVAETEAEEVVEGVAEPEPVDPFWRDTLYLDSISTDTLTPSHRWAFSISDGNFPGNTSPWSVLKGIESDGKGKFWFMSGNPARIVHYEGSELKWSRNIGVDLNESFGSLFKIFGDSIWFVDEAERHVYRLHKDGKGPIDSFEYHMAVGKMFSDCFFKDRQIFIQTFDTIASAFEYYRITLPNKIDSIVQEEYCDSDDHMYETDCPHAFKYSYIDSVDGLKLFSNMPTGYDYGVIYDIALLFGNGQYVRDIVLAERDWYHCCSGYSRYDEAHSVNSDILREGKLYTGGEAIRYDKNHRVFYLLEYDIDAYVKELLRRSDEKQKLTE